MVVTSRRKVTANYGGGPSFGAGCIPAPTSRSAHQAPSRTRIVNRNGIEGQIEGGIAMGLGYALSEELIIEHGRVRNPSFRDYHVMTAPEMPRIDMTFLETVDAEGPAGAKGIAELPTIVIAPAIGNAFYNATGVRIDHPPLTAERVARAIWEQAQGMRRAAE